MHAFMQAIVSCLDNMHFMNKYIFSKLVVISITAVFTCRTRMFPSYRCFVMLTWEEGQNELGFLGIDGKERDLLKMKYLFLFFVFP